MLVFTRRQEDAVVVGDDIVIKVVSIRGDSVRLGITAPRHVPVHREEVWQLIQKERKEAQGGQEEA